jgi:hypothetical protein
MSVAAYFGKGQGALRLREGEIADGRVTGAVLEGKMTAEEARALDAARARKAEGAAGPRYGSVEEYDPVLRAHCRVG